MIQGPYAMLTPVFASLASILRMTSYRKCVTRDTHESRKKKIRSLTFKPSLAVSFQAPGKHLSRTMAEEGRNHSIPSGHDEDYVYPPGENFQCIICQLPSKEPVQTSCGHRFCKQCLVEYFRR